MLSTVISIDTIVPRLNHLEYWLIGRHRHLLLAKPLKILRTSAIMGQKVVVLEVIN